MIEDCTSVLYNIMFTGIPEDDQCNSRKCDTGKCICMDNEQAGLFRKLLSEKDQIAMCPTDERFFFNNMQSQFYEEGVCKQAPFNQDIYCNVFYRNRYFPQSKKILCQMVEKYTYSDNRLMDVIKSVPIIFVINSLHKIKERDSLIYLCRYSPCAERYMSVLLRAIICRTIGCCQRAKNQEEKEAYVSRLAGLLHRLAAVLDYDGTEMLDQYIDTVDMYIDMWRAAGLRESAAENISHELRRYREELCRSKRKRMATYEDGRYDKLYCILKKILETADVSITALPDLPFADFEDGETDYDIVMSILDNVKNDVGKLAEIWSILSRIFWSGEDIPSDEMEEMERLGGQVEQN